MWRSEKIIGQVTKWKPNAKTPRGCPRQRWKDTVDKDQEELEIENRLEMANERNRWRQVSSCCIYGPKRFLKCRI